MGSRIGALGAAGWAMIELWWWLVLDGWWLLVGWVRLSGGVVVWVGVLERMMST